MSITLRSIFCRAFVMVIFEYGKYRKVWLINNLHKYELVK